MLCAHGPVRVTVVAAYTAMVDLVRFVQGLHPAAEYIVDDAGDRFEVLCVSADSVQGETLDHMVLALPPATSQWSEWLSDTSRLLTIVSRYRRLLAMTYVVDDGIPVHAQNCKDAVRAVLDLQKHAGASWTWQTMLETLTFKEDDSARIWKRWEDVAEAFTRTATPTAAELPASSPPQVAPGLPRSRTPAFSTPLCYRGHRLLLLRYMC